MEVAKILIEEISYLLCIIGATISLQILFKRYLKFKKKCKKKTKHLLCTCIDVNHCHKMCNAKQRFYENPPE